ncbi:MAG: rhomboid family intramembrane serine protease [Candidatus Atribacteria bacterium]|nr:rhomboid family intramembrane serine protease [Candidatus Atribacteria bacterium]
MFPIRDSQPTRTFPFVTIALIVINLLIFIFIYFSAIAAPEPDLYLANVYMKFGLVPAKVFGTVPSGNVPWLLTFITSIFLHGSWSHVIFNMLYLWIFGNNIEDYLGHFHFVIFYLLAGIFSSLVQVIVMSQANVPIIGASGAIAGVMGAYFLFFPRSKVRTLVVIIYFITFIDVPAPVYLLIWFLLQLFEGFTSFGAATGTAFFAHVGGFIFGFLYALIVRAIYKRRRGYESYF